MRRVRFGPHMIMSHDILGKTNLLCTQFPNTPGHELSQLISYKSVCCSNLPNICFRNPLSLCSTSPSRPHLPTHPTLLNTMLWPVVSSATIAYVVGICLPSEFNQKSCSMHVGLHPFLTPLWIHSREVQIHSMVYNYNLPHSHVDSFSFVCYLIWPWMYPFVYSSVIAGFESWISFPCHTGEQPSPGELQLARR